MEVSIGSCERVLRKVERPGVRGVREGDMVSSSPGSRIVLRRGGRYNCLERGRSAFATSKLWASRRV